MKEEYNENEIKMDLEDIIYYAQICLKELPQCSVRRKMIIKEVLRDINLATLYKE